MTELTHDVRERLPAALLERLQGVDAEGEVELDGGHVARWSGLELTVGRPDVEPAQALHADDRATVQLARSRERRLLLGLIPWGYRDWLHVELRSRRERLVDLRALAPERVLSGLPWGGRRRGGDVPLQSALAVISSALRLGADLAPWDSIQAVDPRRRTPGRRTVPPEEPTTQPDTEASEPGSEDPDEAAGWADGRARAVATSLVLPAMAATAAFVGGWFTTWFIGVVAGSVGLVFGVRRWLTRLRRGSSSWPMAPAASAVLLVATCALLGHELGHVVPPAFERPLPIMSGRAPVDTYPRALLRVTPDLETEPDFAARAFANDLACEVMPIRPKHSTRSAQVFAWAGCCRDGGELAGCPSAMTEPVVRVFDADTARDRRLEEAIDRAERRHGLVSHPSAVTVHVEPRVTLGERKRVEPLPRWPYWILWSAGAALALLILIHSSWRHFGPSDE